MSAGARRAQIIWQVKQLASIEQQQAYYDAAQTWTHCCPNVASELVNQWFDFFNPQYWSNEKSRQEYRENLPLSDYEYETLFAFTEYFIDRIKKLPNDWPTMKTSPVWQEIVVYANQLLDKLDWRKFSEEEVLTLYNQDDPDTPL